MKRDVVLGPVDDVDHERVPVPDRQRRAGILAVDCDDVVGPAQPLHWRRFHLRARTHARLDSKHVHTTQERGDVTISTYDRHTTNSWWWTSALAQPNSSNNSKHWMIESLRTSMSQLNPVMGGGGDDGTEHEGGWLIYAHQQWVCLRLED